MSLITSARKLTGESPTLSMDVSVPEQRSSTQSPGPSKIRRLGRAIITAPASAGREYKHTYLQAREDTHHIKSLTAPTRRSALGYAVWKATFGDRHEDDGILADYHEARELMKSQHGERVENGTAVTKMDMIRYNLWRWFGALYQSGDDSLTFPLFSITEESMGTAAAFAITAPISGFWADGMGEGERGAQTWKAHAGGIDVIPYEGSMTPKVVDASFNAALWQVQQTASEPREDGEPVQILTHGQVAQSSASYAIANTSLYALANRIPVVNGWGAFLAGVAAIQLTKHAASNYQASGRDEHLPVQENLV